ncbi:MAG: HlyD family type I secretion periplasmic adaptor subunit [Magnetococcales bacterium]|nr:HlyD family type I secretion periplasmic adaptor subunit [Magnetococcales bacterium]
MFARMRGKQKSQDKQGRGSAPGGIIAPDALEFQPALDEIIAEEPPRRLLRVLTLMLGFFAVMLTISICFDVDIVVVGSGRLTTSRPTIVLQPLERSVIRQLNVRPGDKVSKGQILAHLDPTFTQADVSQLFVQRQALIAQVSRLEAELGSGEYTPTDDKIRDQVLQANLFERRRSQYASRIQEFDEEINTESSSLDALEKDRKNLLRNLDIAKQVKDMRESLLESNTGSKLNVLDSEYSLIRVERELQNVISRSVERRHALTAKRAARQSFMDEWRGQILENLVKSRQELSRIEENLHKATRMQDLVQLTAPNDGVVLEVADRSEGSVVREAEPLIVLVRSDDTLIVEIEIASADVGYVRQGDPVRIKIDAFPYQRHGMLEGTLRDVIQDSSANRASGQTEGSNAQRPRSGLGQFAVHRAYVDITNRELQNLPENTRLIPGMTLNAEIKVGMRSIISYFLFPVLRGFGESIREP